MFTSNLFHSRVLKTRTGNYVFDAGAFSEHGLNYLFTINLLRWDKYDYFLKIPTMAAETSLQHPLFLSDREGGGVCVYQAAPCGTEQMSQQAARQTANGPHREHVVRYMKGGDGLMRTKRRHTHTHTH